MKDHSKIRKDLQKSWIDNIITNSSIYEILKQFRSLVNIRLSKYTDKEFIGFLSEQETTDGIHSIHQWEDFIEFKKYVTINEFYEKNIKIKKSEEK